MIWTVFMNVWLFWTFWTFAFAQLAKILSQNAFSKCDKTHFCQFSNYHLYPAIISIFATRVTNLVTFCKTKMWQNFLYIVTLRSVHNMQQPHQNHNILWNVHWSWICHKIKQESTQPITTPAYQSVNPNKTIHANWLSASGQREIHKTTKTWTQSWCHMNYLYIKNNQ